MRGPTGARTYSPTCPCAETQPDPKGLPLDSQWQCDACTQLWRLARGERRGSLGGGVVLGGVVVGGTQAHRGRPHWVRTGPNQALAAGRRALAASAPDPDARAEPLATLTGRLRLFATGLEEATRQQDLDRLAEVERLTAELAQRGAADPDALALAVWEEAQRRAKAASRVARAHGRGRRVLRAVGWANLLLVGVPVAALAMAMQPAALLPGAAVAALAWHLAQRFRTRRSRSDNDDE